MSGKQKRTQVILASAVFAAIGGTMAQATTYFWDPAGAPNNGGIWDTTSLDWTTAIGGSATNWPNNLGASADDVSLNSGGLNSTSVITIGDGLAIHVHNITNSITNATINSGTVTPGTLTFDGTAPTVNAANTTGSLNLTAVIVGGTDALNLTSTGGTGFVFGNSASTYSHGTNVNGATSQNLAISFAANSTVDGDGHITNGPAGTGVVTLAPSASKTITVTTNMDSLTLDNPLNLVPNGNSSTIAFGDANHAALNFGGNITLAASGLSIASRASGGGVGNSITFSGVISDGGSGFNLSLTGMSSGSQGLGSFVFSGTGANTYTGATNVNQSVLILNKSGVNAIAGNLVFAATGFSNSTPTVQLDADEQIANTSFISFSLLTAPSSATFDLNGHNETIAALTSVTNNTTSTNVAKGTVTNNGASNTVSTLTIDLTGTHSFESIIQDGALGGKVGLVLTATADNLIQNLENVNTYTGSTLIKAGTLGLAATTNLTDTTNVGSIASSNVITVGDSASPAFAAKLNVTAVPTAWKVGDAAAPAQVLNGLGTVVADNNTSVQIGTKGTIGAGTRTAVGNASNSTGTLTISGNSANLTLVGTTGAGTTGATVDFNIGASSTGLINLIGTSSTLTLGSGTNYLLDISDMSGGAFNPQVGGTFVLISYTGANPASLGNWSFVLPNMSQWVGIQPVVEFGANDLQVVIPEPTSLGLLGVTAIGLLARRRRCLPVPVIS